MVFDRAAELLDPGRARAARIGRAAEASTLHKVVQKVEAADPAAVAPQTLRSAYSVTPSTDEIDVSLYDLPPAAASLWYQIADG
jgi:hypothetical protein